MAKKDFRKVFNWIPWVNVGMLGAWLGLFLIDIIRFGTRNGAILVILFSLTLLSVAVDSLMEENPEHQKKYFIQWLITSGLLAFFAFTIWVWLPGG